MNTREALEKTLEEIVINQSFDQLEVFKDSQTWFLLTEEGREKLAILFVVYGEQLLNLGKGRPSDLFERATKIAPSCSKLFARLAVAYCNKAPNPHYLFLARQAAEQSLALDPKNVTALTILCEVLVNLGLNSDECDLFIEADKKFQCLDKLYQENEMKEAAYFYRWGLCWHYIAKRSGEASDYHLAIAKYRLAISKNFQTSKSLNDFGNALVDLGCLLRQEAFFIEAIELYRQVVKNTPEFFEGWFNLACSYQRVYEITQNNQFFHQAYECFERASFLNVRESILWFKWAQLLVLLGKQKRRIDFIQASLERFEKADIGNPNNPQILCDWAEALLLVGEDKGQLDFLREAEAKIYHSVELKSDFPESWCIYGSCLMAIGRYFSDELFYHQAVEKFQHGLSLNRNNAQLWHGLALANFALGELEYDHVLIERAVRNFSRAVEFSGNRFLQFWNDWGVALMKLGEMIVDRNCVELGMQKLEHAIKMHCRKYETSSLNMQWLYNYGCALDFLGDFHLDGKYYQQAIQIFSQVLAADPEFMAARFSLAIALSHLGEMEADLEMFQKAIDQYEILTSFDVEDDMAWNEWGLSLLHNAQLVHDDDEPQLAMKYYQEAEEKLLNAVSFGNTQAFYNLACLYSLTGNYNASIHYLARAEASDSLPSTESLLDDEWLSPVRETDAFRTFLSQISTKIEQKKPE